MMTDLIPALRHHSSSKINSFKDCQPSTSAILESPGILDNTQRTFSTHSSIAQLNGRHSFTDQNVEELDSSAEDDFADEDEYFAWAIQQNDARPRGFRPISTEARRTSKRKESEPTPRNPLITAPFTSIDSFVHNDIRLAPNAFVELHNGDFDKDFMKIIHIVKDMNTSEVTLRGYVFRRTKEMNGVIEKKLNEVCWIIHLDDDDERPPSIQSIETVSVKEVLKRRRIRLTNLPFPRLSWRDDHSKDNLEDVESDRVLVCRYKYVCHYPSTKARLSNAWCEEGFHRLTQSDCDKGFDNDTPDKELRSLWRGVTIPGGAQKGWIPGEKKHLRQEKRSDQGLMGKQSLISAFGPNFSSDEPMHRGSVGRVLGPQYLSASGDDENKANHKVSTINAIEDEDADSESYDPSHPESHTQQRQRVRRGRRTYPSATVASDHDSEDASAIFGLSRDLRLSSIEPIHRKRISLQTVEIEAHIKSSSTSGILQKRYKGKIISTYIPSPAPRKKRTIDVSNNVQERPSKQVNYSERPSIGSSRNRLAQSIHEDSSFDSDVTVGHSQAGDSEYIMDSSTPQRKSGVHGNLPGLPTPISLVKRKHDDIHTFAGKNTLTPSTKNREVGSYDSVIDLTKPQAIDYNFHPINHRSLHSRNSQMRMFASLNGKTDKSGSPLPFTGTSPRTPISRNRSLSPTPRLNMRGHDTTRGFLKPRISSVRPILQPQRSLIPANAPDQVRTNHPDRLQTRQQRYTMIDAFAGAGGMSRGAINAGLRIEGAFDFNPTACQTYALNFFGTPIYNVWANEFADASRNFKADICHLSPPCQFFSAAHTKVGKDDDMNTASLFAIFNLLEKVKPRVVTLEQTSGLIRRHPIFFNAVINMFTSRGFSARWKVMNCADFGLPQRRMRVFIIASW